MTDETDGADLAVMNKARELFGFVAGLGGFETAVSELVAYVRAERLAAQPSAEPVAWIVRHPADTINTRYEVYSRAEDAGRHAAEFPGVSRVVALVEAPTAQQVQPQPGQQDDSPAITAAWQDFCRTAAYRRALDWVKQDETPGALFVAFRTGLDRAAQQVRPNLWQAAARAWAKSLGTAISVDDDPTEAIRALVNAARVQPAAQQVQPAAPAAPQATVEGSRLSQNEEDPGVLWAEIARLCAALRGPNGFATWQDAAVAERVRRVKAEAALAAAPQAAQPSKTSWRIGEKALTPYGVGTVSRISSGTGFTEYFFADLTLPVGRFAVNERDMREAPQAAPTEPQRESVDDALMIVESYGPWGADLNDAHRRQIVLADEVLRLRKLYGMAVQGRADFRDALRAERASAPQAAQPQPLTYMQIAELVLRVVYEGDASTPHRDAWVSEIGIPIARAIEAAHGIKAPSAAQEATP